MGRHRSEGGVLLRLCARCGSQVAYQLAPFVDAVRSELSSCSVVSLHQVADTPKVSCPRHVSLEALRLHFCLLCCVEADSMTLFVHVLRSLRLYSEGVLLLLLVILMPW